MQYHGEPASVDRELRRLTKTLQNITAELSAEIKRSKRDELEDVSAPLFPEIEEYLQEFKLRLDAATIADWKAAALIVNVVDALVLAVHSAGSYPRHISKIGNRNGGKKSGDKRRAERKCVEHFDSFVDEYHRKHPNSTQAEFCRAFGKKCPGAPSDRTVGPHFAKWVARMK